VAANGAFLVAVDRILVPSYGARPLMKSWPLSADILSVLTTQDTTTRGVQPISA
jgi:hypothetical protein